MRTALLFASFGLFVLPAGAVVQQSRRDYAPAEVIKTTPFWLMYVMFVMVGTGGLMATLTGGADLPRRI